MKKIIFFFGIFSFLSIAYSQPTLSSLQSSVEATKLVMDFLPGLPAVNGMDLKSISTNNLLSTNEQVVHFDIIFSKTDASLTTTKCGLYVDVKPDTNGNLMIILPSNQTHAYLNIKACLDNEDTF